MVYATWEKEKAGKKIKAWEKEKRSEEFDFPRGLWREREDGVFGFEDKQICGVRYERGWGF